LISSSLLKVDFDNGKYEEMPLDDEPSGKIKMGGLYLLIKRFKREEH
jgi:hypothetical protein